LVVGMTNFIFSVLISAVSVSAAPAPQFTDCTDAVNKGMVFVAKAELERIKTSARGVHPDSSRRFREADHNWFLASAYLLDNKCESQFDRLLDFHNTLGRLNDIRMLKAYYGSYLGRCTVGVDCL
jgi:hypothetical protein